MLVWLQRYGKGYMMHVILLSGGSGKRLWPLSNEVRSKQFIRILKNGKTGKYESMVQRVYRQILEVDENASITIATSKQQVSSIKNQLGDGVSICIEPCRKDTFPAVALASLYLYDVKKVPADEPVIVCPIDPYVDDSYFKNIQVLSYLAKKGDRNLSLLGIVPTYPSAKYGYIIPEDKASVSNVVCFREKPDEVTAKQYIEQGALWNGGVFAFKLQFLLEKASLLCGYSRYRDLLEQYHALEKISFDYAIAEKESSIQVLRYESDWKDIGTWNTFAEVMDEPVLGNVVLDDSCENTNVINSLNVPVLCMGLKNVIVALSNDGLLVSDKNLSSYIKKHVDFFDQQIRFAEKSWGSFTVLDVQDKSMTIKVLLKSGNKLNYHSHEHRDEVWTVVSGEGVACVDGKTFDVIPGSIIKLNRGERHTILAVTELYLIEVQTGDIDVKDKTVYPNCFA
jgi:mannose-1-phosphate guanylyltransferase